jgi:hypothetical protein
MRIKTVCRPALAKHACRKTLEESGSEPPSVSLHRRIPKDVFLQASWPRAGREIVFISVKGRGKRFCHK